MGAYQDSLIDIPSANPSHPAKYTEILLPTMAKMLRGRKSVLDPFAGSGRCFLLEKWLSDCVVSGIEIEEEWCRINPRTTLGNALHLPWPDGYFDAVCTSPTYGNRFGDTTINPSDGRWQRVAYTANLGRKLHPDNSGGIQWGDKYKVFHRLAWTEARRALALGGALVINCKDHIRAGKAERVTEWHIDCLQELGFRLVEHVQIDTPSMRYGRNSEARMPYESVILFRLETKQDFTP